MQEIQNQKQLAFYLEKHHIRYQCPNQTISSVSQTAARLHYSLRQTQRVLQELTKEGLLKRKGKGHYALKEHDESGCSAFLMKKKDCFM